MDEKRVLAILLEYNNDRPHSLRFCSLCGNLGKINYIAREHQVIPEMFTSRELVVGKKTYYLCSDSCVHFLVLSGKLEVPKKVWAKIP